MDVTPTKNYLDSNILCNECKSIEVLAKGAANIAHYNFKWHFTTLVLINSTLICGVNAFMNSYKKNVIFVDDIIPKLSRRTRQFVLFGYTLQNVIILLSWIQKYKFDNTGRILIICQSDKTRECDEKEAVKILWEHRVLNVIFMNLSHQGIGYSYDIGQSCEEGPPVEVKNWHACFHSGNLCGNKFPMKLNNFKGCPITVSTFIQQPYMELNNGVPSGADGDLLRILIKALNASLIIKMPWRGDGWGYLDEKGNWVGSLGDIYHNLANFSMTSASITETRYTDFQMSRFYFNLRLVWVTHPPLEEASTFKLMRPFKSDSRVVLVIFFIIFFLLILALETNIFTLLFKKKNVFCLPKNTAFHSLEMCMGQSVTMGRKKTEVLSLILIWIFYCFLIRTFYQVYLINSLQTDVYLTNLMTIEDAIKEKYNYGGGIALKDYYIEQRDIYNNWKEVNSINYFKIMYNLTKGTKFVLAMNMATTKCFLMKPGRKLYVLPQNIVITPTVLFFNKFSPLVEPINRILERLVEFGIPQMLFKNSTTTRFVHKSSKRYKAIKLKECAGCFVILSIGWLLSLIILIMELFIKKFKSTLQHRQQNNITDIKNIKQ